MTATIDLPHTDARSEPHALATFAVAPVVAVVACRSLLLLGFAGRYGWHRDELYYFAAGRHPDLGFVDFPPITPMLAGLSRLLFGDSLVGLRSFAALAGAGVVVLAAAIARELGAHGRGQGLAALGVGFSPLVLGSNGLFQTVSFDQLAWAAIFLVVIRMQRTGDGRGWPLLGVVVAVALLTKYTAGVLVAGTGLGLLVTDHGRRLVRDRRVWAAALIAGALLLPNVWWQVEHGWPSIDFFSGRSEVVRAENPLGIYVRDLLAMAGPIGLVVAVIGLRRLAQDPRHRSVAIAAVFVAVAFLVLGGKGYYAAPVHIVLLSAGAAALELFGPTARRAAPVALIAVLLPFLPLALPVLPESRMVDLGLHEVREDYAEEIGWPELVTTVAAAWDRLPPAERGRAAIVTANYGEAGAIELYGPAHGLPRPFSGHLNYRYWDGANRTATTVVAVGFPQAWTDRHCRDVERVAVLTNHAGVANEESGAAVVLCRLHDDVGSLRPALERPLEPR
jgi:hypothetical protein